MYDYEVTIAFKATSGELAVTLAKAVEKNLQEGRYALTDFFSRDRSSFKDCSIVSLESVRTIRAKVPCS